MTLLWRGGVYDPTSESNYDKCHPRMTSKPVTGGYGDWTWLSVVFIFRTQDSHQEEVQATWGGHEQTSLLASGSQTPALFTRNVSKDAEG